MQQQGCADEYKYKWSKMVFCRQPPALTPPHWSITAGRIFLYSVMFLFFLLDDLPVSSLLLSHSALHLKQLHPYFFSHWSNRENSMSLWNCLKFRLKRTKSSLTLLLKRLFPPADSGRSHCHWLQYGERHSPLCLCWNFFYFWMLGSASCRRLYCATWCFCCCLFNSGLWGQEKNFPY